MLTRLKVDGFKNLVDLDVRFGPFTCIAGLNGVGKSNLFDAIRFLSMLAGGQTLLDAALSVRDEKGRTNEISSIFTQVNGQMLQAMSFEAYMIVPPEARDDLGQNAKANTTFLKYILKIRLRKEALATLHANPLEITEEGLEYIKKKDIAEHLRFPTGREWKDSVIQKNKSLSTHFITTQNGVESNHEKKIVLHSTKRGRPRSYLAGDLTKTVMGTATASESPTAVCAMQEMRSWQLLQFEPSALRKPDSLNAKPHLESDGAHIAATLYHLANHIWPQQHGLDGAAAYQTVTNKLAELVQDIRGIEVERDDKRDLLTLYGIFKNGDRLPTRSLSDGTLRFLALAVLEMDPQANRIICLEEPENGIHPDRIQDMIRLLKDIAVDPSCPNDETNPLRQVIINTHSPLVVANVDDADLLYGLLEPFNPKEKGITSDRWMNRIALKCVTKTWREELGMEVLSKGHIQAYLQPIPRPKTPGDERSNSDPKIVRERSDLWAEQLAFDFQD